MPGLEPLAAATSAASDAATQVPAWWSVVSGGAQHEGTALDECESESESERQAVDRIVSQCAAQLSLFDGQPPPGASSLGAGMVGEVGMVGVRQLRHHYDSSF